jgi:hypothetical protein
MGFIYRLTSPSGKSYIGQTIRPIEQRFQQHQYPSDCVAIFNAIQKHGWENMKKEWYEVPDEDLNFYEEMMIALLGTLSPGGYNLTEGGGNGKPSEETRKKMSEARQGEKHHMYGKQHTDDTKQKISESHKGERNHNFGKSKSEETKLKMSIAAKGEKNHFYGKKHTEETKHKIGVAQIGKIVSENTKQKMRGENNHMSKKVYQYDRNGNYIQSFSSSSEASQFIGKKSSSLISSCARGKPGTAYGFKWTYEKL